MDRPCNHYDKTPMFISYPGWSKSEYIKYHGKQNGTIAWLENENRELKSEMKDMMDIIQQMEKRINLIEKKS